MAPRRSSKDDRHIKPQSKVWTEPIIPQRKRASSVPVTGSRKTLSDDGLRQSTIWTAFSTYNPAAAPQNTSDTNSISTVTKTTISPHQSDIPKNTKMAIAKKSREAARSKGSQRRLVMELTKMMGWISLTGRDMGEGDQMRVVDAGSKGKNRVGGVKDGASGAGQENEKGKDEWEM